MGRAMQVVPPMGMAPPPMGMSPRMAPPMRPPMPIARGPIGVVPP